MAEQKDELYAYDAEYRDTIATVDQRGKRIWVYPKRPSGKYHRLRIGVSVFLLTLFFAGPFIRVGGQPFLLINIFDRHFILFGQVFWPQDFFLLALTLITFFIFVILFTVSFGRLWCGWACPQTLFMEMVFRKIEYWIEGDAPAQRRLAAAPWNAEKILRKGGKQLVFLIISLLIAHVAMAYLIGIGEVREIVTRPPSAHMSGFIGLLAFTAIFYGVFAYFREQACVAVCPYGRLQGVLLTKDSLAVAYDWIRGEPRGKIRRQQENQETATTGDCIDCKLCVHVCPTGIDIRNGTQLECVNCSACIDACDEVMVKTGKPTGLIRIDSYNALRDGVKRIMNPRTVGYSVVLTLLIGLLGYLIFTRSEIETTVLKAPGTLYSTDDNGQITNIYNLEFVNKTFRDILLDVRILEPATATLEKIGQDAAVVRKESMLKAMYIVRIPPSDLREVKTRVVFAISEGDRRIETVSARFVGPIGRFKTTP